MLTQTHWRDNLPKLTSFVGQTSHPVSCNTRYFSNERLHVSRCSQAPCICKLDTLIKPGLGEIYVAFCFVLDYGEELVGGYAKMYKVENLIQIETGKCLDISNDTLPHLCYM